VERTGSDISVKPDRGAGLRIDLFGVPRASYDGSTLNIATRPLCAVLLAMLALAPGRRLSRKTVAGDLWPDDDDATAAANLRRHISALTTALPDDRVWFERDREALWWSTDAPVLCDVALFEAGDDDRYTADFMQGYAHEWVVAQRERLRVRAVDSLLLRAIDRQENDDLAGALVAAGRAIELDPYNEAAGQLEIELHGERGDLAAMHRAATSLEERLREIDVEPGETTRTLIERFRHATATATSRLPRPVTSFVGGDEMVREIVAALATHRLVSVVGSGGVGKTRAAIEAAHRAAASFADGAYFVDLSAVTVDDAVVDAVLRALGVPSALAAQGFEGACAFLRNRRTLIVLDNCEHVVDTTAWLTSELLQAAPRVGILATSREALGLAVERVCRVQPLAPEVAVALFVERARNVAPGGEVTAADRVRVERVCGQLDRLPLAIELAAGLLGSLTIEQVETNLADRFGLLHSRDRTVPHRHRTLERVIEWSVARLKPVEREALAKIAIFTGSFDLDAAAAICGVELGTIVALVEKSVLARDGPDSGRFRLLISIASYARRLLAERDDEGRLHDAHVAYYERLFASVESQFWEREVRWLASVDRDFGNVTAALQWALHRDGAHDIGIRLAITLWPYFERRGYSVDGTMWMSAALEHAAGRSPERARLLLGRSYIELRMQQVEAAAVGFVEAASIFEACGLIAETARAFAGASGAYFHLRRDADAARVLDRAERFADACVDRRIQAIVLANRGFFRSRAGDRVGACALYGEALPIYEAIGDRGSAARMLNNLAAHEFMVGRYAAAEAFLIRALALVREVNDPLLTAGVLSDLGDIAILQSDAALAR
jgi:predicted ATPase/DNA-binding SARP family transcriptional activator